MTKLKERIHRLVDDLPASDLRAAERLLQSLREAGSDPVLRALAVAPIDDEPFSAKDEAAVRAAYEDIARGDVVPHPAGDSATEAVNWEVVWTRSATEDRRRTDAVTEPEWSKR